MPVHRIHQTASPYNASELRALDYEQTADVLYFAHENHAPTKLVRAGHADWSFSTIAFGPSFTAPTGVAVAATVPNTDAANSGNAYFPQTDSYVVTAVDDETGQESRASSSASATNDLGLKRNYNSVTWTGNGADRYRIYKSHNQREYGYIGEATGTTFRDDNIGPDLSEGPPQGDNPFGTAGDYPGTVTFHEQRSFWGRSINRPNAIWASRSANYENFDFSRPGRADDGFAIGLVANKVNAVNNLVSSKQGLLALTSHNIFTVQGSNEDYIAATPPPRVRPEISRGVSRLKPIIVDSTIFYETAKLSSVRTIGYQFELDGIRTDDVTVFSPHLFENQDIVAWAFAEKPASAIWLVRGDGKLLCLTWEQEQQVWGWTLCETDGLYKDVCVISENGEDRAYFVVERTVGGTARKFIERMASELWQDQEDACYLDCARTFVNAVPTATIDRLDHLEGRIVKALADGNVVGGLVVQNGRITLPQAARKVHVGLPYEAFIETLPLAFQGRGGWIVAKPQHVNEAVIRVVRSRGVLVGPDEANVFAVKQRHTESYGAPTDLFTGDLAAPIAGTSGRECTIVVKSADPVPFHVAGIMIDPAVQE